MKATATYTITLDLPDSLEECQEALGESFTTPEQAAREEFSQVVLEHEGGLDINFTYEIDTRSLPKSF